MGMEMEVEMESKWLQRIGVRVGIRTVFKDA